MAESLSNDTKRLAQLAEDMGLDLDLVAHVDHVGERLKLGILKAAAQQGGLPLAQHAFTELIDVISRGPDLGPACDVNLSDAGVHMRAVNFYERHDCLTIGELLQHGPVVHDVARRWSFTEMQLALLAVIDHLVKRIDAPREALKEDSSGKR